jgi:glycerophosphoryl diester phosphodiesterase
MKIISHRGASAYAPENTLKAFTLAVEMGSRDFEFDVHRTKDGILVVHHDFDLKRTAGHAARISDLTYSELRKYNVAAGFRRDCGFQCVPRLEEVLDVIEPHAEGLNFEVKNDHNAYPGIEEQLLDFLKSKHGLLERVVVSSFDHATLKGLRELSPKLKLAYLGHNLSPMLLLPAVKKAKEVGAVGFHLALRIAFKLNVSRLKEAGFWVGVYTVNSQKDALRMKEIGVDGIFTNHPDILAQWTRPG